MSHHYNKEELVELKRKHDMQVEKEALEEIKHSIDLVVENERLHNTIKEAIEYIDHCIFDYEEYSMVGEDFVIVKNILQGSDKE